MINTWLKSQVFTSKSSRIKGKAFIRAKTFQLIYELNGCFCRCLTASVFGLAEVGDFKVQMFNLVQKFIRIPNVQFSTSAPILANPCYLLAFCLSSIFVVLFLFQKTINCCPFWVLVDFVSKTTY
jgi:hypothetical protein